MTLLLSMACALGLTLVLELGFSLFWGLRKRELLLVILMNILTNPAVNLLYILTVYLMGWPALPVVVLLEAAAVVTEGFCSRGMIRRPWLFAILINAFSYSTGELLKFLI